MEDRGPKRMPLKASRPRWKDKLKEVCLQRVRHERNQLLWNIREGGTSSHASSAQIKKEFAESEFGRIVADELSKVQQPSDQQGSCKDGYTDQDTEQMLWEYEPGMSPGELADEDYEELLLAMERALYDDLEADLRCQEAALLEDYEAAHALEDESLAELIAKWEERVEGGVLCPLCRTKELQQIDQIIFCACGDFRLDTQDSQIGLDYLKVRLADVHEEHLDSGCRRQPSFTIESPFELTALYMQCAHCRSFQWVL